MKFERLKVYHVALPLIEPWRTAYGQDDAIGSVLLELTSQGQTVWAETTPLASPCYSAEWSGGVFALLRDWLIPSVIGQSFDSAAALGQHLQHFKGNPFAKASLDIGWWLLDAKLRNLPLHQSLSNHLQTNQLTSEEDGATASVQSETRQSIAVGADLGVKDTIEELLAAVQQVVDAGYARLKLKYKPGWDLAMLTTVRKTFPDIPLHIDCNSGYTLDDMPMFQAIDKLGLTMIEQPLSHDDLHDHAILQAVLDTPICLDESINSPFRMTQAIELNSCQYVNIKPGRVGGLSAALNIYQQCQNANIGLWVGGMLESAVGANICAALASLKGFDYPPDLFPSDRFYANDLSLPHVTLSPNAQGQPSLTLSNAPGISAQPDPSRLKQCTIDAAEFSCDA